MLHRLALALVLLAPAASAAWPTAHGGLDNHRAAESALDADALDRLAEAWRAPTRGAVTGTPVHDGETVFFGGWGGLVHAVDLDDGVEVWRREHGARVDASIAIAGDRVLVPDATGNLTALAKATGEKLWSTWVEPKRGVHLWGSPAVHEGRVYIGIASEQTEIDYEGPQDFRGGVACLDLATGAILWKTYTQPPEGRGVSVWSTPALDPELGLLFVGSGNAYGAPAGDLSDALIALRMDTGAVAWSHQATEDDTFDARGSPGPDADIGASPILIDVDGLKLVADGDKGGQFFALDRATGELRWRVRADFVGDLKPAEKEGFLGTAAYEDGVIFAPTTARSMVHAIAARTGEILWSRELNEKPRDYGERMFAPTTVTNGIVLQGNAFGALHLLDARDGTVLRRIDHGADIQGGIGVAPRHLLVPDAGSEVWGATGNVTAYRIPGEGPAPTPTTPATPTRATPPPALTPSPTTQAATPPQQLPTVEVGSAARADGGSSTPGPALAVLILAGAAAAACRTRR